jgi:hypothetical protein
VADDATAAAEHERYIFTVAAALTREGFFGRDAAAELAEQEEAAGGDELYEASRAARNAAARVKAEG